MNTSRSILKNSLSFMPRLEPGLKVKEGLSFLFFFVFWWYWGLNSGLHTLRPHTQTFFALVIFPDRVLYFLPEAGLRL
jgi:hypothetical protein